MQQRFLQASSIALLFNLAVAQPLFDLLGRNPEFFVARQSHPIDVVCFAVITAIVIPVLMLGFLWTIQRISVSIERFAWNMLFCLLTMLFFLPLLKEVNIVPAMATVFLSFLAAFGVWLSFRKSETVRWLFKYFSALVLVIPILFLTQNSIAKIIHPDRVQDRVFAKVTSTAPVVFLILDELPLVSLLGSDGNIDAARYPHFAELQQDSVWFRNATTVADATPEAVSAILTGKYPSEDRLPTLQDYPDNLFTMLAGSYQMKIRENISQMCPQNAKTGEGAEKTFPRRIGEMLMDLSAVYLHVVVPDDLRGNLPSLNEKWGNFWEDAGDSNGRQPVRYAERAEQFRRFLESIEASEKPVLYFQHIFLPHIPWEFLPNGKFYDYRGYGPMGIEGMSVKEEEWIKDDWVVHRAYQRHLLQVGYVDRLIGRLVERLKSQHLYDRSLILITADHGASFRAGDRVRSITPSNYDDILPVPVILKLPGQKSGKVIDRNFETIDILPSIADSLGIEPVFATDGQSAFKDSPERPKKKVLKAIFAKSKQWQEFEAKIPYTESVQRKIDLFGASLSHINWYGHRTPESIRPFDATAKDYEPLVIEIKNHAAFDNIDLKSNFLPVFITGRVFFERMPPEEILLGVRINGVFQGVTRTFKPDQRDIRGWLKTIWMQPPAGNDSFKPRDTRAFGFIAPEAAFRQGRNHVEVMRIQQDQQER